MAFPEQELPITSFDTAQSYRMRLALADQLPPDLVLVLPVTAGKGFLARLEQLPLLRHRVADLLQINVLSSYVVTVYQILNRVSSAFFTAVDSAGQHPPLPELVLAYYQAIRLAFDSFSEETALAYLAVLLLVQEYMQSNGITTPIAIESNNFYNDFIGTTSAVWPTYILPFGLSLGIDLATNTTILTTVTGDWNKKVNAMQIAVESMLRDWAIIQLIPPLEPSNIHSLGGKQIVYPVFLNTYRQPTAADLALVFDQCEPNRFVPLIVAQKPRLALGLEEEDNSALIKYYRSPMPETNDWITTEVVPAFEWKKRVKSHSISGVIMLTREVKKSKKLTFLYDLDAGTLVYNYLPAVSNDVDPFDFLQKVFPRLLLNGGVVKNGETTVKGSTTAPEGQRSLPEGGNGSIKEREPDLNDEDEDLATIEEDDSSSEVDAEIKEEALDAEEDIGTSSADFTFILPGLLLDSFILFDMARRLPFFYRYIRMYEHKNALPDIGKWFMYFRFPFEPEKYQVRINANQIKLDPLEVEVKFRIIDLALKEPFITIFGYLMQWIMVHENPQTFFPNGPEQILSKALYQQIFGLNSATAAYLENVDQMKDARYNKGVVARVDQQVKYFDQYPDDYESFPSDRHFTLQQVDMPSSRGTSPNGMIIREVSRSPSLISLSTPRRGDLSGGLNTPSSLGQITPSSSGRASGQVTPNMYSNALASINGTGFDSTNQVEFLVRSCSNSSFPNLRIIPGKPILCDNSALYVPLTSKQVNNGLGMQFSSRSDGSPQGTNRSVTSPTSTVIRTPVISSGSRSRTPRASSTPVKGNSKLDNRKGPLLFGTSSGGTIDKTVISLLAQAYPQENATKDSFYRLASPPTGNTLLYAILSAIDDPILSSLERKGYFNYLSMLRQKIAATINPQVCKQELYDLSVIQIRERLADSDYPLDSALYYRALEEFFQVNLMVWVYVFSSSQKYDLELPRHANFHNHQVRMDWPVIVVLKMELTEGNASASPYYELIVQEPADKGLLKVFGPLMAEQLADLYRQKQKVVVMTPPILNVTDSPVLPKSDFLDNPSFDWRPLELLVIENTIPIPQAQILDGFGKQRGLVLRYNLPEVLPLLLTVFFLPRQPDSLTQLLPPFSRSENEPLLVSSPQQRVSTMLTLRQLQLAQQRNDLTITGYCPVATVEILRTLFADKPSAKTISSNLVVGFWYETLGLKHALYFPIKPITIESIPIEWANEVSEEYPCEYLNYQLIPSSSYKESNVQPSPKESNVQPSPKGSNLQPSQKESNLQSSQKESNLQSSQKESNLQSSPKESNLQSSPKESNVQPSQKELTVRKLQQIERTRSQLFSLLHWIYLVTLKEVKARARLVNTESSRPMGFTSPKIGLGLKPSSPAANNKIVGQRQTVLQQLNDLIIVAPGKYNFSNLAEELEAMTSLQELLKLLEQTGLTIKSGGSDSYLIRAGNEKLAQEFRQFWFKMAGVVNPLLLEIPNYLSGKYSRYNDFRQDNGVVTFGQQQMRMALEPNIRTEVYTRLPILKPDNKKIKGFSKSGPLIFLHKERYYLMILLSIAETGNSSERGQILALQKSLAKITGGNIVIDPENGDIETNEGKLKMVRDNETGATVIRNYPYVVYDILIDGTMELTSDQSGGQIPYLERAVMVIDERNRDVAMLPL